MSKDLLPGFAEAKARVEAKGYKADWITETVDPNAQGAMFLRKGKIHYKSDCPHYEGYWLCGGIGSVQCTTSIELLLGLQHDLMCSKEYTKCKYYL